MTLIIDASEVLEVFQMPAAITAMEQAFAEEARSVAVNHPRQRYRVPPRSIPEKVSYMANIIAGAVPSMNVAALRYDSMLVTEKESFGKKRKEFSYPQKRSWGFVLLFDLKSAEPLAVIQDFSLSPLRVGATTGVAVKYLSNTKSQKVGLLGSGNEARRNLEAISLVRKISSVKVYSPNEEHRRTFAKEMSEQSKLEIIPVNDPREAVRGADILMCATNSIDPVFDGAWLERGQLVVTIANSDVAHRRSEADSNTFVASDLIVLNNKKSAMDNQQVELLDLIKDGKVSWDKVTELGSVIINEHPGRTSDSQIVYYKSNSGLGIQFAAACRLIYDACKKRHLGREIPTEWFGADISAWLEKGYNPSP